MLACGLTCALAIATPAAAQTGANPDTGQAGAKSDTEQTAAKPESGPAAPKPEAGNKSPSGEGAAAAAPAGSSPGEVASSPGGLSEPAGAKPAEATTAGKKASKAKSAAGAKGGVSPLQSLGLSSEGGPIDVRSDTLDLDYKAELVLYRGHVHATQGSSSLSSDTLQVLYKGDFHEVKEVIATGHVIVAQGGRWATGERAKLNQVDHTVEMTGYPVVHDGPDQVAGTRILIYLDSQKSVVEHAHAVIFPRKAENRDDQKPNDHDR
jgi:lipopolysaccharide transport protein LptA